VRVGITVSGEEQRMAALNADVLVITVPVDETLIGVVAEEARQGVTDTRRRAVQREICRAASACSIN